MTRNNSFSSSVTWPPAAMQAVTAANTCCLTFGAVWANWARAASNADSVHCDCASNVARGKRNSMPAWNARCAPLAEPVPLMRHSLNRCYRVCHWLSQCPPPPRRPA